MEGMLIVLVNSKFNVGVTVTLIKTKGSDFVTISNHIQQLVTNELEQQWHNTWYRSNFEDLQVHKQTMTSPFQCRHGRGTWLHLNSSVKIKEGKHIPVQENELPHNCHLSPFYHSSNTGKVKARAVRMQALSRIDENQIVLDPLMGSGVTGIAALNLKRKFISIEIDRSRFEVAKANISNSLVRVQCVLGEEF